MNSANDKIDDNNQVSDGEKTSGQTNSRHDGMLCKLLHLNIVKGFKSIKIRLSQ